MSKDIIKLPPLPKGDIAADTCPVMWVHTDQQLESYALEAIKADRQQRGEGAQFDTSEQEQVDDKGWFIGDLLTLNLDGYPALGRFFVQIWEGDFVIARVYGDSEEEARSRANILLAQKEKNNV